MSIRDLENTEICKEENKSQVWWGMPITSAAGRLRQEDCKFKATLGYVETLSQKKDEEKIAHDSITPK
jgi:hypothetical protein